MLNRLSKGGFLGLSFGIFVMVGSAMFFGCKIQNEFFRLFDCVMLFYVLYLLWRYLIVLLFLGVWDIFMPIIG